MFYTCTARFDVTEDIYHSHAPTVRSLLLLFTDAFFFDKKNLPCAAATSNHPRPPPPGPNLALSISPIRQARALDKHVTATTAPS